MLFSSIFCKVSSCKLLIAKDVSSCHSTTIYNQINDTMAIQQESVLVLLSVLQCGKGYDRRIKVRCS